MQRGMRRLLGVLVLAICLAAPIVDVFEHWDSGGTDVEGTLVVVMLCVGAGLAAGAAVHSRSPLARSSPRLFVLVRLSVTPGLFLALGPATPATSPPTPLRV